MVEQEITLLQFDGGGTPLTPAERQQAAQIVREAMNEPAAHWAEVNGREQRVIAALASHNVKITTRTWDTARYNYAFQTGEGPLRRWFLMEKRIIEAHDPVLALDAAHQRMVTAHMLPALRQVSAWAAAAYGLAPPQSDFDAVLRDKIQHLATVDPPVAEGLAHIVRNQPYLESYFAGLPQQARVKFISQSKSIFNNLNEPGMEEWEIAEAGAMISAFAAKQGGGAASMQDRLYSQKMMQWSLGNAARAHSPSCNPTLSADTRSGNNCLSPIPVPGVP